MEPAWRISSLQVCLSVGKKVWGIYGVVRCARKMASLQRHTDKERGEG